MVERGLDLTDPITQSANGRGLETVDTLGNLKPREDSDPSVSTSSGFKLPEARAWGEKYAAVASFNSCIYGLPYWKRSTWRGELSDRATLTGDCRCGIPRSRHLTIRGKARSRESAK